MRHFKISLIFILTTLSSFGQFDILWDDDPGVTYNGQTINILKIMLVLMYICIVKIILDLL